jgi:hypothetical protein
MPVINLELPVLSLSAGYLGFMRQATGASCGSKGQSSAVQQTGFRGSARPARQWRMSTNPIPEQQRTAPGPPRRNGR